MLFHLRFAVLPSLFVFGLCVAATAHASPLEKWRSEITDARALAENDAPSAYSDAQRLQAAMPDDANAADKARIINLLARIELYLGLTAKSAQHAAEARAIAKQNNDREGQIKADINSSLNAINQGRLDDMIESTKDGMDLLTGSEREDMRAEVMFHAAMMYLRFGQLDEAATTAMQSLDIARNSANMMARTYAIQGVAAVYDQSGRRAEALEYYQHMLEMARQAHSTLREADAMLGIAGMSAQQGGYESSDSQFQQVITMYRRVGAPFYVGHAIFQLADRYFRGKKPARALSLLDEDVTIYEKYDNPIGLWWTLNARSTVLQALGRLDAAHSDAERASDLAKKIGFSVYLAGSARRLADVAAAQGEFQQAYRLSAQAAELNSKVEREKTSKHILELAQRFQQESKQRQINELTRLNLDLSAKQRWQLTVLGGSIGLFLITGFFVLRLRRSREKIRILNTDLEKRVHERTAELNASYNFLDSVIDSVSDPIFVKDRQHRWTLLNDAFCAFIGHPRETLLGKSDHDFFHRDQAEVFWEKDELVFNSGKINLNEEYFTTASGEEHYIQTKKTPFVSGDGRPMLVGVIRDITDNKRYEIAREAALVEAKRLAHTRSEFLAQMSHELRTPLNSILGYAQIMGRDIKLTEQQLAWVQVIRQSGEHLLSLINDILDFAKIDASKIGLFPSDFALDKFLHTIVEIVRMKAEQKHLSFVCDFAADLPKGIHADEKRLRQVLLNLLANAVKFTDHGQVTFQVRHTPPSRLYFGVRDSGIGIASEYLEEIFKPFEQLSDARHQTGGTGLGLPISRQLVRLMKSDIHVDSRPGEGSNFWFELEVPLLHSSSVESTVSGKVTGYLGARRKILVVDDVAENRAMLVDMLEQLGFEISVAVNGGEGLEKAQALQPDLILIDVVMPVMSGIEVVRHLRRIPGMEKLPVIAISASVSGSDETGCLDAGMNVFLAKPIEMELLLQHISALLSLEWEYVLPPVQTARAAEISLAPPQAEIERLHELALQGDMRAILQVAEHLDGLSDDYRPFAAELRQLARSYQSKAILNFVEHYLTREPAK